MALWREGTVSKKEAAATVKTCPITLLEPRSFSTRFAAAAHAAGFTRTTFGEVPTGSLDGYVRSAAASLPRIYLSAGIHGDEPAPPQALLALLEAGFFTESVAWTLCPLLNPSGFVARTRENAARIDLNRDYRRPQSTEIAAHVRWLESQGRFDLVLCLHEDWETAGFYLYEQNPRGRPSLAPAIIAAAREHCPIEPATTIDGRDTAEAGIIRPTLDPLLRETWPETVYLRQHRCDLLYTLETPSALPLAQRIETHRAAIARACGALLRSSSALGHAGLDKIVD